MASMKVYGLKLGLNEDGGRNLYHHYEEIQFKSGLNLDVNHDVHHQYRDF